MPLKPKRFLRELQSYGIEVVNRKGKGSHARLKNPANGLTSELPMHSAELSKSLERKILKDLGLQDIFQRR